MYIALICIAIFVYVEYREVMQSKAKHRQESTVTYCNWCIFCIVYIGNTLFIDRHITKKNFTYHAIAATVPWNPIRWWFIASIYMTSLPHCIAQLRPFTSYKYL